MGRRKSEEELVTKLISFPKTTADKIEEVVVEKKENKELGATFTGVVLECVNKHLKPKKNRSK